MHGYGLYGMHAAGYPGAFGFGGMVFGLLGFLLLVIGIAVLVSMTRRHGAYAHMAGHGCATQLAAPVGSMGPGPDTAEAIARERLARGEIDADEFTRIVAALRG